MISWTKIADDNWLVRWDGKVKRFNDQMKVILWTLALEVHIDEIERAMLSIINQDDNYCEFGLWKTFVYSDKIGVESNEKKLSC
jgi:hypothetical protein